MHCRNCNKEITDEAAFCMYCGAVLEIEEEKSQENIMMEKEEPAGKEDEKKWRDGIIAIGLILALLLLISYGMNRVKDPMEVEKYKEISAVQEYFHNQGYDKIIDITMEKRQTNKEEKIDYLYCDIKVENDSVRKTGNYEIFSRYYDEGGWIIDEIVENSYTYEPISEPDIYFIYWTDESQFSTVYDTEPYDYSYAYGVNCYERNINLYNDNAKELQVKSLNWIEGDLEATIDYCEVFEYPNFDVGHDYWLVAEFNTVEGIWEVRELFFYGMEYSNYRFSGCYYWEPSGRISGDDGTYFVTLENEDEINRKINLELSGFIDYGRRDEPVYYVTQMGSNRVKMYDVNELPEEIINDIGRDFSGYFVSGNVGAAFNLNDYEPALLMVTPCNMLSKYSPEKIYNVYILVKTDECMIGVKETSNTDKFRSHVMTRTE